MGFFGFLKEKKKISITSPAEGECVPISQVNDETFAQEILGKGVAVWPENGKIYAPISGKVSAVFPTGHAVGITTDEGVEVMVHVGINTVEMAGKGFQAKVKIDQEVKQGDLIIECDLDEIKKSGYETVVLTVLCECGEYSNISKKESGRMTSKDEVMSCAKA